MATTYECKRIDRRRTALLVAARSLFIEQGFEGTTLGQVVARAGGALATVYKLFGNKDGLLDAVMTESASSNETLVWEVAQSCASPSEALHRIAFGLREYLMDRDTIALIRIAVARSIEDVEVARIVYERTNTKSRDALVALFTRWQQQGLSLHAPADILAEAFIGMLTSDVFKEAITHGAAHRLTDENFAIRTNMFLRGAGLLEQDGQN